MDELGPDEQRFLDALRADDGPTAADHARVRAAVLARVAGVGAGVVATAKLAQFAGAAGAASTKAAGGTLAAFLTSWKVGVAVVSLVVIGGASSAVIHARTSAATVRSANAAAVAPATVPAPASPAAESPVALEPAAVTPEPPPAAASAQTPPHASPVAAPAAASSGANDIEGELQLLTEAQQALKRGDPSAALVSLAKHGREFPRGALSVERDGLRAVASCEAKRPDGHALAERFLARSPRSPLVARVRAACLSP